MTDSATGTPRRYTAVKRDLKRAEIVDAATREMNEHGVQGLVLADVAARVGMTKANLTYYFRRKEDLAALCIGQTLDAYQGMIAEAAKRGTVRERFLALYALFFARAARAARDLEAPLVVLSSPRALEEPYGAEATRHYSEMLQAAAALFETPEAPPMSRVDRLVRAQLALTHLFWAAAWLRQCDPGDYPRIARRLFDIVADGLALPGAERPTATEPAAAAGDQDPRAVFYQSATRLINLLGYRGASIHRIGAAVNVTKGSVYHHHTSKDELVLACSERSFTAMWAIIRRVESEAGDPWAQLAGLVEALGRHQLGETGPFLRASVLGALPDPLREGLTMQWARIVNHLAGLVSDGVSAAAVRPVDPALAAQVIAAGVNATDEIGGILRHRGLDDVVGRCVGPTLHGLFSPGPAAPTDREAVRD